MSALPPRADIAERDCYLCQKHTFNHVVEKLSELSGEVWQQAERKLWFNVAECPLMTQSAPSSLLVVTSDELPAARKAMRSSSLDSGLVERAHIPSLMIASCSVDFAAEY